MASHRLAESSQESTTLSRSLEELGTISCPEKIITFVRPYPPLRERLSAKAGGDAAHQVARQHWN